jgi:NADH:ubiquinone oxidoreductase subunit 6 (subunit J)
MLIVYVGAVAVLFLFVCNDVNVAQQKINGLPQKKAQDHIPVGLINSTLIFLN